MCVVFKYIAYTNVQKWHIEMCSIKATHKNGTPVIHQSHVGLTQRGVLPCSTTFVTVSAKPVLIGTFSNMRKTNLKYLSFCGSVNLCWTLDLQ